MLLGDPEDSPVLVPKFMKPLTGKWYQSPHNLWKIFTISLGERVSEFRDNFEVYYKYFSRY